MRVVGINLGAQPQQTGVVLLEGHERWSLKLSPFAELATDDKLVELAAAADVIGIDAPLGWPVDFAAALAAHERSKPWLDKVDRKNLFQRRTDAMFEEGWEPWSPSVEAEKFGVIAMRCALLQERFAMEAWGGERQPRDGSGRLMETSPDLAMNLWGALSSDFKGTRPRTRAVRERMLRGFGGLFGDESILPAALASDHVLDAAVSALVAWFVANGYDSGLPDSPEDRRLASIEGWIRMPPGT